MKKLIALLIVAALALAVGCASNTKVVETIDPATGKVTGRTTTSKTDTSSQGDQQIAYAKLLAKHGIFQMEAAEKVTTELVYNEKGEVVGKTITKTVEDIKIAGAKYIRVSPPMPGWKQVEEPWVKALKQSNGWINMLMFGWLFGPQNYDSGTNNYNLATSGPQSNINVGGKQTSLGSHVANSGEGQATGGSMSSSDSSQQNQGDTRGFGDVGSMF